MGPARPRKASDSVSNHANFSPGKDDCTAAGHLPAVVAVNLVR